MGEAVAGNESGTAPAELGSRPAGSFFDGTAEDMLTCGALVILYAYIKISRPP